MEVVTGQLWTCEYCDHAPYHNAKLLERHLAAKHTEDGIKLFKRDMTYRQLVGRAARIAKVVTVVTNFSYDDAYNACYDSLIDLLLAGQPITNRNVRRGAYRALINEHETSLDEMLLDTDDAEDDELWTSSHAYALPEPTTLLTETLLEIATGKFGIESPMLWVDVAETKAVVLLGYDALLANCEDALESRQQAAYALNATEKAKKGYEARMRTLAARKASMA